MAKSFFMVFLFFSVSHLFGVLPPVFCERISTAHPEQVQIKCDGFEVPTLSFIRARHDGENYVDIRKELPANDDCVPPGEYTYYLEQGCTCGFTGYSCRNDLVVVVENHTVECSESGVAVEMTKEEFEAYFSELEYDRDCCEEDISVDIKTVNFGKVVVESVSSSQSVTVETFACSSMPRDMVPEYSFLDESQNSFSVKKGETSESFIPRGWGSSEFIFSFTPTALGDYSETIVFKKFGRDVAVQLNGKGVETADSADSVDDSDSGDTADTVDTGGDVDFVDGGDSGYDAESISTKSSGCSTLFF